MLILAWRVYSSKDLVGTKTVTRDLCPPQPEYSEQDHELYYGPGHTRLVKDNGDRSSEL